VSFSLPKRFRAPETFRPPFFKDNARGRSLDYGARKDSLLKLDFCPSDDLLVADRNGSSLIYRLLSFFHFFLVAIAGKEGSAFLLFALVRGAVAVRLRRGFADLFS